MLTDRSMDQTLDKLTQFSDMLLENMFEPVANVEPGGFVQYDRATYHIPADNEYGPVDPEWGGEGIYGWFTYNYEVPEELAGKALFVRPRGDFFEATLWVNGKVHSNFANKIVEHSHGNHYCNRFTAGAQAHESFRFDMECYAYHYVPGSGPFSSSQRRFTYASGPVEICTRNDFFMEFCFDLKTLLSLRKSLPAGDFRRAELDNTLYSLHKILYYDRDHVDAERFTGAMQEAQPLMKESLSRKNSESAPFVGLIGHSHMDTAWLWPITETINKCARTYANSLNLMEEYPEYRFVQSSAYHAEVLRRNYPELFERIREAVATGRYEPNGGVWVECDCNLTGGEYMVRQFVWGQRYTRKWFGYTADCFWLPDTFGYSCAIPQIMKGCGVDYFLTTKIAWGDTTKFPLTSFYWQGMDGTRVFTHFNRIHIGPSPENLRAMVDESEMKEHRVSNMRLFSFGKGDGGGGPEFEMLEMARRLSDLEGTPRSGYVSVSDFMKEMESTAVEPSVYAGELYLELHRGTLTNQHRIKRNNRDLEIALHDLELALVMKGLREGTPADERVADPMMETLLVHQFHDILPGTCIHAAHEEAYASVEEAIGRTRTALEENLSGEEGSGSASVLNPMAFDRTRRFNLSGARQIRGARTQVYRDVYGEEKTVVAGLTLPALSVTRLEEGAPIEAASPFVLAGDQLSTPYADIILDEKGGLASYVDKRTGRELVKGLPFNTFLLAEDVPAYWDNWDIDADIEGRFVPAGKLISREVISDGAVELRIRSVYEIGEKSRITQDMIFSADSPEIEFETLMDWQEDHRFLKAAFDTVLVADGARQEIQFGHIRRSNHRSTPEEKAKFEICNHKFTDLSEQNFGVTILNDCKYGISVNEGSLRLSLHKGGSRPDIEGDKGLHYCRYAFRVHEGGFSAANTVAPAYAFNYLPVETKASPVGSLVRLDEGGVVLETVKPCEDSQNAFILRLYEAEGGYSRTALHFGFPVKSVKECNMLEEEIRDVDPEEVLSFAPFKIRTFKVSY